MPDPSSTPPAARLPLIARLGSLEALGFLLGFGYLGFWVFGLVMGVFSIGELLPLTIAAVVIVIGSAIRGLYSRRVVSEHRGHQPEDVQRASRHQREVRGY